MRAKASPKERDKYRKTVVRQEMRSSGVGHLNGFPEAEVGELLDFELRELEEFEAGVVNL